MKTRFVVIFALLAFVLVASCTPHRTCPTYLKNNAKPAAQEAKV